MMSDHPGSYPVRYPPEVGFGWRRVRNVDDTIYICILYTVTTLYDMILPVNTLSRNDPQLLIKITMCIHID